MGLTSETDTAVVGFCFGGNGGGMPGKIAPYRLNGRVIDSGQGYVSLRKSGSAWRRSG